MFTVPLLYFDYNPKLGVKSVRQVPLDASVRKHTRNVTTVQYSTELKRYFLRPPWPRGRMGLEVTFL